MQVNRNIETRSCNHCCSRKGISIVYSECVFLDLGIQHAMRTRHIVICDLPGSTIFLNIISLTARFLGRGKLLKKQCLFWVSLQFLSETVLILRFSFYDTYSFSAATMVTRTCLNVTIYLHCLSC